MNFAEARRSVAKAEAETEELLAELRKALATTTPMPDDWAEAYDKYVIWEHLKTGLPVTGITDIQRRVLAETSLLKVENGKRQAGKDIWLKSRRVHMTSLWLGLACLAMVRFPFFKVVVVMPGRDNGPEIKEMCHSVVRMAERFPADWPRPEVHETSSSFRYSNGSTFIIRGAGASISAANKKGRGTGADFLIFSEPHVYSNPAHTWASFKGMVPEGSGWIVSEATAPEYREQWQAAEWFATRDGRGTFDHAGFVPWYADPNRRVRRGTKAYTKVMNKDFEDQMGADEVAVEDALGLDDRQRAWRRNNYFSGDARTIRQNHRECPETPDDAFIAPEVDSYVSLDALDLLDAQVRPPDIHEELATDWTGQVWRQAPHALLVCDSAAKDGRDACVVLAIDSDTLDLVGLVHGHASPRQHYLGVLWLLDQIGCRASNRHVVSAERNKDVGLLDYLAADRTLTHYHRRVQDVKTRVWSESRDIGHVLTRQNRRKMITMLVTHLEGDQLAVDSEDGEFGPQSDLPSEILAHEARYLVMYDSGKVAAAEGHHDDVIISLAAALYIQPRIRRHAQVAPVPSVEANSRTPRARRRPR